MKRPQHEQAKTKIMTFVASRSWYQRGLLMHLIEHFYGALTRESRYRFEKVLHILPVFTHLLGQLQNRRSLMIIWKSFSVLLSKGGAGYIIPDFMEELTGLASMNGKGYVVISYQIISKILLFYSFRYSFCMLVSSNAISHRLLLIAVSNTPQPCNTHRVLFKWNCER